MDNAVTTYQIPALTSFVAQVERSLTGGTSRVLKVVAASERTSLVKETLELNVAGLEVGYVVEDCVPLVLRKAGTSRYGRHEGALVLFLSEYSALAALAQMEAQSGIELVIEPLTEEITKEYGCWVVME